jgi:hypothetical protein
VSAQRFDELTKTLADGTSSRRKFLAGLGTVAAAVLVGPRGAGAISGDCSNHGQSCTAQKCCQGFDCLTDMTSSTEKFCCSPNSTLVCGRSCCPTGALGNCSAGQCVCPLGEVVCPDANNPLAGRCVNLLEDPDNCSACGTVCPGPTGSDAPCRVRACVNGTCTTVPNPLLATQVIPCDDGNPCTVGDTCSQSGICQPGTPVQCAQCLFCDPAGTSPTCVPDQAQVGRPCNDSNACTANDVCTATLGVATGMCAGTPITCDDNNDCTTDTCNPDSGCVFTPVADNTPCETSNRCTADFCEGGTCKQGPDVVTPTCAQCKACGPTTGNCDVNLSGTPCNDNNVCTAGDTCQNGVCQPGAPVPNCCRTDTDCPKPSDQCKRATCVNNVCVVGNAPNGTGCNDNNACTTGDTCQGGVCTGGTLKTCPSGQTCVPATGKCECTVGVTCGNICCTGSQSFCCPPGTGRAGQCRANLNACM